MILLFYSNMENLVLWTRSETNGSAKFIKMLFYIRFSVNGCGCPATAGLVSGFVRRVSSKYNATLAQTPGPDLV